MENWEFRTGKWSAGPIRRFSIPGFRFPVFHFLPLSTLPYVFSEPFRAHCYSPIPSQKQRNGI